MLKRLIWGRQGEPYLFEGKTLRFDVGSRPTKRKYRHSDNWVNRYDALQIDCFAKYIGPGCFCLDVGGHSGESAILMASAASPSGRIVSFEPDAVAATRLERNVARNSGIATISVERLAISDTKGTTKFFSLSGNANSSLAPVGSVRDGEVTDVETMSIDEYLQSNQLPVPDLIKIDIEGAEIHAVRGAKATLQANTIFLVELHPYAWKEFGVQYEELEQCAAESNREIVYLDQIEAFKGDPHYGTVLLRRRAV